MDVPNVARRSVAEDLSVILESVEVSHLVDELQATRWTGRPGYPLRAMIGMALAKSLYALPTWTRTVALVSEHAALAAVIASDGDVPSVYACYRFTAKLREHTHLLEGCIARVVKELKRRNPVLGWDVAIDASDMPAYANGQRFVSNGGRERLDSEFSDPDASWGHRSAVSTRKGGGFYGYRLHMAVCSKTDLPLAWTVETARDHETLSVAPLLDRLHTLGIDPETCALDKGYDNNRVYGDCAERSVLPVIPLRKTPDVKKGKDKPPTCEHGEWRFAGADRKRNACKWRCPTGECTPASVWIKADRLHPLIPRETLRWKALYRRRASVERAFGRLKHDWSLAPLRVRRIERVRLHADLTILSQLTTALSRQRVASGSARAA
jgi:transposase